MTVIKDGGFLSGINQRTKEMMKASGNDFLAKRAADPAYTPLHGAPVCVVFSAPGGNDSQGFNMANAACAAQNMMLGAVDAGLGSCLVMAPMMAFQDSALQNRLDTPDGFLPLCGVVLGYPEPAGAPAERPEKENTNWI